MTELQRTATDEQLLEAMRWAKCSMAVIHGGGLEPCEKPAVGVLVDEFEGDTFASSACAWHINRAGAGAGVPLHRLLALVWDQAKRDGLKQSDWEHGDTPVMFVAHNPYREVLDLGEEVEQPSELLAQVRDAINPGEESA